MQFPLYVYRKEGPHSHGALGNFDSKVVYKEEDLIESIKNGWHPDFQAVISGSVVFNNEETNGEEPIAQKEVVKRGRKPKVDSELENVHKETIESSDEIEMSSEG